MEGRAAGRCAVGAYFGIRGPGYLVGEMPAPLKVPGVVYAFLHRAPHVGPREAVRPTPGGDSVQRLIFIVNESVRGDVLSVNGFGPDQTGKAAAALLNPASVVARRAE